MWKQFLFKLSNLTQSVKTLIKSVENAVNDIVCSMTVHRLIILI
jgi:hypothetical protein